MQIGIINILLCLKKNREKKNMNIPIEGQLLINKA